MPFFPTTARVMPTDSAAVTTQARIVMARCFQKANCLAWSLLLSNLMNAFRVFYMNSIMDTSDGNIIVAMKDGNKIPVVGIIILVGSLLTFSMTRDS